MSVLVRDVSENRYYIFIKGAPEKIYNKCVNQNEKYHKIVSELSLSGFRSIGFGYRRVDERDLEKVLL